LAESILLCHLSIQHPSRAQSRITGLSVVPTRIGMYLTRIVLQGEREGDDKKKKKARGKTTCKMVLRKVMFKMESDRRQPCGIGMNC
jgi:hypothetical protein